MFRLVTLNLNGIRSAAAKGFLPFADKLRADCMGVQEIKAQAADMAGRFEHVGGTIRRTDPSGFSSRCSRSAQAAIGRSDVTRLPVASMQL